MVLDNEKANELRDDFPIFKSSGMNNFTYLDNGATSQKPLQVIKSLSNYYEKDNSNIHRGIYDISERSGQLYHDSKLNVAKFINASHEEIIYTRNTTESLNLVANSLFKFLESEGLSSEKNEILVTMMEHHSNFVPWQQLAKLKGFKLKFIELTDDFTLDLSDAESKINDKTAILAFTHVSNTLGTINPAKKLIELARKHNVITVVDAAQSAPHMKLDVKELDCDFLAFSSHKMLGPMGMGVLYGKKEFLEKIPPFLFGGDMISDVSRDDSSWNSLPMKFEAGTPNVAGAVGLSCAIDYLQSVGMDEIDSWEKTLAQYAEDKLKEIDGITIYRTQKGEKSGIVSFSVANLHHHDIAQYLSDNGICIRVGHHCTMPLMKTIGIEGTARVSFYLYNTKNDVDYFITTLKDAIKLFKS